MGEEDTGRRFLGTLSGLHPAEQALYEALRENRYGPRVRLEQERIAYAAVRDAVRQISVQPIFTACDAIQSITTEFNGALEGSLHE